MVIKSNVNDLIDSILNGGDYNEAQIDLGIELLVRDGYGDLAIMDVIAAWISSTEGICDYDRVREMFRRKFKR